MSDQRVSDRLIDQRLRNRIMESLSWLARGEPGVMHMGAHEWFEQFFCWHDHRDGPFENDAMTEEEISAYLVVYALMSAACDGTPRKVTEAQLLATSWVETVAAAARSALVVMEKRGRFSEEVEETEPGQT